MSLSFRTYRVDQLGSLRSFFPEGTPRRGVYVLRFADGQGYVGQATDVCARFLQHRRTYPDLIGLRFAPILPSTTAEQLNTLEQAQIRTEATHTELRNVRHYQGRLHGVSKLDPIVPSEHQLQFLQTGDAGDDIAGRVVTEEQRRLGEKAFARLMDDPCADEVIRLGALYVICTIPNPRATERRFWACSAAPSTNGGGRLLCFSINSPETFVIFVSGEQNLQAMINVSRTVLVDEYDSLDEFARTRRGWLELEENAGYEACGGDATMIRVHNTDDLVHLLTAEENDGVLRAAAALNLMLMRKGPTLQARWHNVPLADDMFELLDQVEDHE